MYFDLHSHGIVMIKTTSWTTFGVKGGITTLIYEHLLFTNRFTDLAPPPPPAQTPHILSMESRILQWRQHQETTTTTNRRRQVAPPSSVCPDAGCGQWWSGGDAEEEEGQGDGGQAEPTGQEESGDGGEHRDVFYFCEENGAEVWPLHSSLVARGHLGELCTCMIMCYNMDSRHNMLLSLV